MRNGEDGWASDFPIREQIEDYAGRMRSFVINCHEGGLGFTVRAEEEGCRGAGYQFAAYSETSPYSALGRVRQKMHRGLATRHVTGSPGDYRMLHDRLSGRITSDGKGGVLLIVDGIALGLQDLAANALAGTKWSRCLSQTCRRARNDCPLPPGTRHLGANITGLSNTAEQLSGKRLELLKELVPGLMRVAVLRNRRIPPTLSSCGRRKRQR